MIKTKPMYAKTRGSVLLIVIIICLISAIVGVGFLSLSLNTRMMGIRSAADISARCAADAAIAHAVFQMNEKLKIKPWDDSSLPFVSNMSLPNCDATCGYTVSNISGNYVINATGRASRGIRNIKGILRIQSVFDYALFAKDTLELKNSATVDWCNNQPDDWPMQIGTNSTAGGAITFMSSTTINGDVLVGVGGDPSTVIDAKSDVTVTGSSYAIHSNVVLPTITVPDWLSAMTSGGDLEVENPQTTKTISTSGKYDNLSLGNSKELIFDEPVSLYITEDIILGNDAKIVIGGPNDVDNDASLIIYLAGNFESKNSSQINNLTADARRFTMYGLDSCTKLTIKNGCNLYGAIYAPNADITIDNSGSIYGSVVGKSVTLMNSGTFYYDAALRDRTVNDEAVRFTVQRWQE
jgi:choice-of-anchor A domain-containing protein